MPGGKLVVVDLEVRDGRLAAVQLSGDFFLEPDSALDAINHALAGQSAHADEAALAAVVRNALGADVMMYGISPEAIAVAVRRALHKEPEA
ncbi:biotin--protein ligase [Rhodanobacter lindaniclasticus]